MPRLGLGLARHLDAEPVAWFVQRVCQHADVVTVYEDAVRDAVRSLREHCSVRCTSFVRRGGGRSRNETAPGWIQAPSAREESQCAPSQTTSCTIRDRRCPQPQARAARERGILAARPRANVLRMPRPRAETRRTSVVGCEPKPSRPKHMPAGRAIAGRSPRASRCSSAGADKRARDSTFLPVRGCDELERVLCIAQRAVAHCQLRERLRVRAVPSMGELVGAQDDVVRLECRQQHRIRDRIGAEALAERTGAPLLPTRSSPDRTPWARRPSSPGAPPPTSRRARRSSAMPTPASAHTGNRMATPRRIPDSAPPSAP
jgi:hypothetical protein